MRQVSIMGENHGENRRGENRARDILGWLGAVAGPAGTHKPKKNSCQAWQEFITNGMTVSIAQ
jgi:hypothetical protein